MVNYYECNLPFAFLSVIRHVKIILLSIDTPQLAPQDNMFSRLVMTPLDVIKASSWIRRLEQ